MHKHLCLTAIALLTGILFGAEPTSTLPTARTVTDTTGRKLEGTILSKDADSIQFRRTSDGKKFDLPLAKLSADDQTFVAGLVVKKPTVLLVEDPRRPVAEMLEKAGFAVTSLPFENIKEMTVTNKQEPIEVKDSLSTISKMTDDEIKKYDVVWINGHIQHVKLTVKNRIIDLIPACKVVVWNRSWWIKFDDYIGKVSGDGHELARTIPYVKSEKNLIFYYDVSDQYKSPDIKEFPEFREKAVAEAKKLMATYHH